MLLRAWANFSDRGFSRRVFLFRQEFSFSQSFRFFPSFCQALAEDRVTTPTKKKKSANILVVSEGFVKSVGAVFIHQFGSSRKVVVAPWLFKADAVSCCTTSSMYLSSYIGWQVENPVNCV